MNLLKWTFLSMSVREDLVSTAVDFLKTSLETSEHDFNTKRIFLKTKGLTDEEIDIAYQRSKTTLETSEDYNFPVKKVKIIFPKISIFFSLLLVCPLSVQSPGCVVLYVTRLRVSLIKLGTL